MIKYLLSTMAFVFLSVFSFGQDAGDALFDGDLLHEIEFTFTQNGYLQTMERDIVQNFGGDVPYIMADVTINGELIDSVGVRFKGFTSFPFESDKKPFKIDFNEFVEGKEFDGLRKLNLNNGTGDPAMHRDVLCYKMLRDIGVKAPRTAWARLSINGNYWGLYQLIEQVDKDFLQSNFSNADGNLFKNKGWSHFEWLGTNQSAYDAIFDLKTNRLEDDWTGFIDLMDFLNNSSQAAFASGIEEKFNVDLFLKTLAVDVATNNWDSYLEHGRNWYIYEDTKTGIFNWIPWDYNFALDGSDLAPGEDCLILLEVTHYTNGTTTVDFRDLSFIQGNIEYLWDFGDGNTSTERNPTHTYMQAGIYNATLSVIVDGDCQETTEHMVDTDYNTADCSVIVDGSCPYPADIVFQSLLEFAPSCCSNWSSECEDNYGWLSEFFDDALMEPSDFAIDQSENTGVLISRLLEVPQFSERYYTYFCDLLSNVMVEDELFETMDSNKELIMTSLESDPNNLYSYESFLKDVGHYSDEDGLKGILSERISILKDELDDSFSCSSIVKLDFQEVTINEIVASNDSIGGIADPAGGYADWVELYNNTNSVLDLTSVFLSDKNSNLRKWEFPVGTTIEPESYLIIWADDDTEQPGIHANFKLSKSGEALYLSNADGSIIDSISFGAQTTNVALARVPNGDGDFRSWTPTFNMNNELGISATQEISAAHVSLFPNPAANAFTYALHSRAGIKMSHLDVYSANGVLVKHVELYDSKSSKVDVSTLEPGLYNVSLYDTVGHKYVEKLIIYR